MKCTVKECAVASVRDDLLVVGLCEDQRPLSGPAATADTLAGGRIRAAVQLGDVTGKFQQTLLLYTSGNARRVLVVGLGKAADLTRDRLRHASATAARCVRDLGITRYSIPLAFAEMPGLAVPEQARLLAEGAVLGAYRFEHYKTGNAAQKNKQLAGMTIIAETAGDARLARAEVVRTQALLEAVCLARDLVAHPGNVVTPRYLARTASGLAKKHKLRCTIMDAKEAARLGMGAFVSVARGSDEPACFIVLEHRPPAARGTQPVVLIGKAITFDSGGISLKPPANMEEMKTDMAGGAAVLGVMQAVARLALPVNVVGLVPAAENLPSGHALKPGDVVTSLAGKTIEIISTDAEGRLLLADALAYAGRFKPAAIIDLATLTGACIIALGHDATAVMGTDEQLISAILRAGEATGERTWQLPLWDVYSELIKSDIADIKNSGGRAAGTISAGMFLKEFVPAGAAWAHLDIAGTAWTKKQTSCAGKGATGVGVRLLVDVLEHWAPVKT